jgi:hypothetical protein
MARKFNVKGTKEYFYWGIGLLALCAWHLRDGWFPPPRVLEKHPEFPQSAWQLFLNEDHYYDYNRVTAVITGISGTVLLFIHRAVR